MLKHDITFTDFNGEQRTESHYFNISKSEAMEIELLSGERDGFNAHLKRIVNMKDNKEIYRAFKEIVKHGYGVRSADGSRFMKGEQYWADFEASGALDELLIQFLLDANFAANFVKGMLPNDMDAFAERVAASPNGSAAAQARANSEAQMQGYKRPQQREEPVTVQNTDVNSMYPSTVEHHIQRVPDQGQAGFGLPVNVDPNAVVEMNRGYGQSQIKEPYTTIDSPEQEAIRRRDLRG